MRLPAVLALLAVLATPAAAAVAKPPILVGAKGDQQPLHFLTKDLKVVKGSPTFNAERVLLSPNGHEFATWSYPYATVTVHKTSTGRALARFPLHGASALVWPTANHIVSVTSASVRSLDLEQGTEREVPLSGRLVSYARAGQRLHVVAAPPTGATYTAYEIGAAGVVQAQFDIPSENLVYVDAGQTGFLAAGGTTLTLYAPDGTAHAVDVDPALHAGGPITAAWISRDLVSLPTGAARIDPATGAIVDQVAFDGALPEVPQPFEDGFVYGLGEARYDANLDLVATHDPSVETTNARLIGDRLYAQRYVCEGAEDDGVAIADAATGKVIRELDGRWHFGATDGLPLRYPWNDDSCD